MRAWQSTCLPSERAARVAGRWLTGGVATMTASASGDSTTSRQSPTTRPMPNSDATSDALASSLDQTTASSTSSMATSRGRCLARTTPPAPISPILTLSNLVLL